MPTGRACAAALTGFHPTAVPQEDHHVRPMGLGGLDIPENVKRTCCNHHSSIHNLLSAMLRAHRDGTTVPWKTRIRYNPRVRKLAQAAYDQVTADPLWRDGKWHGRRDGKPTE